MGVLNILCLVVILQAVWVRGEDEVIDEEELAKEEKGGKEMDWAEMLQMGMAIGKSLLGEETVEKLKKGDLSELIKVGTKVLGEDTVKDFMNSVTEGAFSPKEGEEEGKDASDTGDILEDDELGDVLEETSETDESDDTSTEIPVSTFEESSQVNVKTI